jgi:phospholipid/cholesterol/gamma-HCH transport system permease protein
MTSDSPRYEVAREGPDVLRVTLSGHWVLTEGLPDPVPLARQLEEGGVKRLTFDSSGLGEWDSALTAFVFGATERAAALGIAPDLGGLPEGLRKLVDLARAVPRRGRVDEAEDHAVTARVGRSALEAWGTAQDALQFLGESTLAVGSILAGRPGFRRSDLFRVLDESGVGALGIVAFVNFLIGTVLAFVGAVQLMQFGAGIYVADLVAIGVTRELGALMTGIVMGGRTGAAFAAVLGTMTVNEEVDALKTMGFEPMQFLVLPRVVGTTLMMPALVIYADVMGMLGGMFVGVALLHIGPIAYLHETRDTLALRHVLIGLAKAVAFGMVVSLTGCYYGIRCGRSAAAVGVATTKAVVMGIVLLVVVDAIFTVLLHAMGL